MAAPQDLRAVGDRIEQLLGELRAAAEPRIYDRAEEVVRLVTQLYGAGLERLVELVGAKDPGLLQVLVDDDLLASLLILHGLHPDDLETRVRQALESVRPLLGAHEGDVELLDIDAPAGAIRLRLLGSCDGCPSSSVTLRMAVERAVTEAAPEIVRIDVDEPSTDDTSVAVRFVSKPTYDHCPTEVVS